MKYIIITGVILLVAYITFTLYTLKEGVEDASPSDMSEPVKSSNNSSSAFKLCMKDSIDPAKYTSCTNCIGHCKDKSGPYLEECIEFNTDFKKCMLDTNVTILTGNRVK
jgi:hypothetical protein